jgi:hypothetical protein
MTLTSNGGYRNLYNTDYKYVLNIKTIDEFKKAMDYDNCAVLFKDNHRMNDNFIKSNCIMLDFDIGALPVKDFYYKYKYINFYLATSKSHNKEKNGKTEPRYHIYLPIPIVEDRQKYAYMILSAMDYFKTADSACKDSSRFFNGNKESKVLYNNGKCILYFIKDIYQKIKNEKTTAETSVFNNIVDCNNWQNYINTILQNEDITNGNRNRVLCSIAGCCKKHNFSVDALYYANAFIGLEDREFNNIVKLYYKGDKNDT